jgi:adenylate cyclase class 2
MSYEVEVKFRVDDHAQLVARLEKFGAIPGESLDQADDYLAHPARDFAKTGEALRLRRDGVANRITYKGPKLGGPTKTREEIEVTVSDGTPAHADLERVFERLGFRQVAEIRKHRRPFHVDYRGTPIEVVLDRVESLGEFAEVEAIAAVEADLPKVQEAVLALARELGLTQVEPRSYLRMYLEQMENHRKPSGRT